ncbi:MULTISPECIES: type II secretion system protein GspL [Cupriavidus]|uniref:General secretion pathway L n=1 Tax=Cupriavidus pinatubonensis (strain JMP 134 / LMG 1197) TaxID=264198 RepID=Q46W97_CUPPJ|nr:MULTISPECIES: type II secretion system protein GspL [Cupriavidus]QYY31420.1 general secretion pathway protein GspL [Cupriavidus pinatubonensis]TPQ42632.1 general secretion pathway protein GspL [Cupriavidus pinatubonensis]
MSTTLYVRLPHRPHDQPQPWHFGALPFALVRDAGMPAARRSDAAQAPEVLREGHAQIGAMPPAERLVLILAASDVLLTTATVPPLPPARLKQALPNLVEDALATDAQPCHIGVGPALDGEAARPARGPRRRLLMVADRAWLRAVLDAFAEHRHRRRHILPAQMCLPLAVPAALAEATDGDNAAAQPATLVVEAAATSLVQAEGMVEPTLAPEAAPASSQWQLTVRTGRHEGYGLLLGTDALAAWQALAPEGLWHGDANAMANAPVPALRQANAADWRMWIAGAQGCLQESGLDLAQFEFAQGRADRWNLLAWRLPLALAAGIVLVQLLGMNIHWLMLHREQQRLEAAQLQTLHTAFPQIQTVLDAPLQMRRQVEQLRLASGRSTPDDFLPLADRFAQAARQLPPDGLQALEYRSRTLVATLKPGTDTAALRGAVRQAGLQMEEDKTADASRTVGPAGSRWVIKPGL